MVVKVGKHKTHSHQPQTLNLRPHVLHNLTLNPKPLTSNPNDTPQRIKIKCANHNALRFIIIYNPNALILTDESPAPGTTWW
jgi:hypothetical protein